MTADIDLQDEVLEQLRRERLVDPTAVRVAVRDGYVRLAGQLGTWEARAAAEWAAGRVAGVKGVESEIVVVPPPPRILS